MIRLVIMFCHQYPRVRKLTASLFGLLIDYTDELSESDEAYKEYTIVCIHVYCIMASHFLNLCIFLIFEKLYFFK